MAGQLRRIEAAIAALAAQHHGVVERAELMAAGFTRHQIDRCVQIGLLEPIHRGIYLVAGGSRLAREYAAVRACRPRALLSHWTAARLLSLPTPSAPGIHVTVVGRGQRAPTGVHVHKIRWLPRAELRRHEGIPITSPSLTLLDLAGLLAADGLEDALHEARAQQLVLDSALRKSLAAHPNRRGARALARLLDREAGVKVTRSPAERRLLRLLRQHGLEPNASDVAFGPYTLDFFYEAERVALEYDSRQYHDHERRFVRDRRKIAYLAARGILTIPFTAHDLAAGAGRAIADLKAALASRRGP